MPVPPGDDVIQLIAVALTVDKHLIIFLLAFFGANLDHLVIIIQCIISIQTWLDVHQLQLSV